MQKGYGIPLILGVTGHRDLRDEDLPELRGSVRAVFAEYQTRYPNTELVVISALAEGADMLVAQVVIMETPPHHSKCSSAPSSLRRILSTSRGGQ